MSSTSAAPAAALEARLATLERRGRALALAVAVLAPVTATLALAAFRRAPLPTLEGERLVLRAADGQSTVMVEPTADGGFRIRTGRLAEVKAPYATPDHPAWSMDGAELILGTGAAARLGGPTTLVPSLELRDPAGRTIARLGPPQARPATP